MTSKIIDPEKVTLETRQKLYEDFSRDPVLENLYPRGDLIQRKNLFVVLDHGKKEIVYYMEYKERDLNGVPAAYQKLVWKNRDTAETKEIPQHVFWKYLFPIHKTVTTDDLQTDLGKGFWHNLIADALRKKFYVYYMDLNQRKIPAPIQSSDDLSNIHQFIWGKGEANRYRLVMVSEKPFETEVGMSLADFGIPEA